MICKGLGSGPPQKTFAGLQACRAVLFAGTHPPPPIGLQRLGPDLQRFWAGTPPENLCRLAGLQGASFAGAQFLAQEQNQVSEVS